MKSLKNTILVTLLVALSGLGLSAAAQTGTIRGEVFDQFSGEELIGANVIVQGTNMGAATNLDGEFVIRSVPAGTHDLLITYIGYEERILADVEVVAGETTTIEIGLFGEGLEGEEVIISVQALGQMAAINRQISSRTVSNIVAADRIREVPDVNAAESIGRLPGVSIQRSGGEASKIAIRGLSPKYNAITVEGVRMSATDRGDRSVDLSMISPNMLDGIEVTKANLPNQDADAIGGTVDLQLRRAPEEFQTDISLEGGYNHLQGSYDNYKFSGSISDRFLDDRLGVIVNLNLESRDRSTDTYNANYRRQRVSEGVYTLAVNNLRLQENTQDRFRRGGSILVDYRIPDGRIVLNSFLNQRTNEGVVRTNSFDLDGLGHDYEFQIFENDLTVWTNMLAVEKDFDIISASGSVSYGSSVNYSPEDKYMDFKEQGGMRLEPIDINDPTTIPLGARLDTTNTFVYSLSQTEYETIEENYDAQANFTMPFRFGTLIDGSFEFGGKYTHTSRVNDRRVDDIDYMMYGGGSDIRRILANEMEGLTLDPDAPQVSRLELWQIRDHGYERDDFLPGLDGDWPVGFTPMESKVREIHDLLRDTLEIDGQGTFSDDYEGSEDLWAGYAMAEINIGRNLMFIPGFRYEHMSTDYEAMRTREARIPERGDPSVAIEPHRAERTNDFFLPMWHLRYSPTDWMDVRAARTNTITRPDYMQFSPRFFIGFYGDWITAGNPDLEPAESLNHDLSVSFYTNYVGMFSVSAFHKKVDGLIFHHQYQDYENMDGERLVDFDYSPGEVRGTPEMNTALNNENPAYYQGVEFDLQTNFWWLPSPFDGIVMSMNYTWIDSETDYPQYRLDSYTPEGEIFPVTIIKDTLRTARMPDQPNHVANFQVGYDLKGFSARVSFLYQGETLQSMGNAPENDRFTEEYFRIDARVRQQLGNGLEIFANLNNLNNRADRNFQSQFGGFPTYHQNYGVTFDLGVRFRY